VVDKFCALEHNELQSDQTFENYFVSICSIFNLSSTLYAYRVQCAKLAEIYKLVYKILVKLLNHDCKKAVLWILSSPLFDE